MIKNWRSAKLDGPKIKIWTVQRSKTSFALVKLTIQFRPIPCAFVRLSHFIKSIFRTVQFHPSGPSTLDLSPANYKPWVMINRIFQPSCYHIAWAFCKLLGQKRIELVYVFRPLTNSDPDQENSEVIRTKVTFLHLEGFLCSGSNLKTTVLFTGHAIITVFWIFFLNQTHNERPNDQQSIQYRPHIRTRPHPQRRTNVCGRLLRGLNIRQLYE